MGVCGRTGSDGHSSYRAHISKLLTCYPALVTPQEVKCSGNIRDLLHQVVQEEMQLRLGLVPSPIALAFMPQRRPGNITCECTIYEAII